MLKPEYEMPGCQDNWPQRDPDDKRCVIIGAGPAGLTAAYELLQTNIVPLVFEQDKIVGGIARTVEHAGYRFDIGGHRFFTKIKLIDDWWKSVLDDEMLVRSRQSRIYYNGRFFDYPLKPLNAIFGLGPVETLLIIMSYLRAKFFPCSDEKSFEEWVCNRFGRRLFEIFFKTYTEKVWGMKCSEIGADWAAQRIKNLDLQQVVKKMFLGNKDDEITTLITSFLYPRLGPGMLWERVAKTLADCGFPVQLGHRVTKLCLQDGRLEGAIIVDSERNETRVAATQFISSMPIKDLVATLDPAPPAHVVEASRNLRYRDFITVGLIVDRPHLFSDNWIYIHSPDVKVGRIQNFKNWSPEMVPDPSKSSLGLEYFVQEGDELWGAEDNELITLATRECSKLGLINSDDFIDGLVIRMPKAYPVYDQFYKENIRIIRDYISTITNLQLVGRNGQHRYNNQDHSMLTGILAAQNICGADFDIWDVNVEGEYHEEKRSEGSAERLVPQPLQTSPIVLLQSAFARYDPIALGCALAVIPSLGLFCMVFPLLVQSERGSKLSLLQSYLFGFDISWTGIAVAILQLISVGFVSGALMALAINRVVEWHERRLFRKLELIEGLSEPPG